ncbi:MAG TPA: hypothetical protein VNO81_14980 [Candidatus Nitrosotenuis sp.]|nr:hypothetical protein [Candidatus Nitrosotenuis sp.]
MIEHFKRECPDLRGDGEAIRVMILQWFLKRFGTRQRIRPLRALLAEYTVGEYAPTLHILPPALRRRGREVRREGRLAPFAIEIRFPPGGKSAKSWTYHFELSSKFADTRYLWPICASHEEHGQVVSQWMTSLMSLFVEEELVPIYAKPLLRKGLHTDLVVELNTHSLRDGRSGLPSHWRTEGLPQWRAEDQRLQDAFGNETDPWSETFTPTNWQKWVEVTREAEDRLRAGRGVSEVGAKALEILKRFDKCGQRPFGALTEQIRRLSEEAQAGNLPGSIDNQRLALAALLYFVESDDELHDSAPDIGYFDDLKVFEFAIPVLSFHGQARDGKAGT